MATLRWSFVLQGLLTTGMAIAAFVSLVHGAAMVTYLGIGWDSHAYYVAWEGPLYEAAPGSRDAFNYSPLFAQATWPLTLLPWPYFSWVSVAAAAIGVIWLCRPLPPLQASLMLIICCVQVFSGNIDWLIAVLLVLGLSSGPAWVPVGVTKVTSCLGPLWFLARGEWQPLRRFLTWMALLCGISIALSHHLWLQWFQFLRDNANGTPGMFTELLPPLAVRLVLATALTVYAARTNRSWILPIAMLIAAPVPGTGPWALLAAIPRLRIRDSRARQASVVREQANQNRSGPSTHVPEDVGGRP